MVLSSPDEAVVEGAESEGAESEGAWSGVGSSVDGTWSDKAGSVVEEGIFAGTVALPGDVVTWVDGVAVTLVQQLATRAMAVPSSSTPNRRCKSAGSASENKATPTPNNTPTP